MLARLISSLMLAALALTAAVGAPRPGAIRARFAAPVLATSGGESHTIVTVYTHDLGFVRQERALAFGDRGDTLRIDDVPRAIDVSSVRLVPRQGRVTRLAYRFDAASGDALLDAARGAHVRVSLRGDRVVEGTLLAADPAWLVLSDANGAVHTLARSSVDDVAVTDAPRLAFTRPGLEAVVEGAGGSTLSAELSYLTGGLSWTAEHTLVRTGETEATWSSGVTVDNTTGRDFRDVALELVAGEPRREAPQPMPMLRAMAPMSVAGGMAKVADLTEQPVGEYHLYTLGRPATLRNEETQKLTMYDPRRIHVAPRYLFRPSDGNGVRTQLELVNDTASGLGMPLPAGRVRVYEPGPGGALEFTGEMSIGHTAEGEKLTLDVGQAFDLVGERKELTNTRISDRERETTVEIRLRNRKASPVTIVVEELVSGDVTVLKSSPEAVRKDASTLQFRVPVAAGAEQVVTYTARFRY